MINCEGYAKEEIWNLSLLEYTMFKEELYKIGWELIKDKISIQGGCDLRG